MNNARSMRWALFLALLWTWPLPLFGLDGSLVPVLRFVQLAASLSVLIAFEGAGGMVGAMLALLWGHAFVYALVLFGVASLSVKLIQSRFPDRASTWITAVIVVAVILWASHIGPYDTMFHHSEAHSSLAELYR